MGSASPWTSHIRNIEEKADELRAAAYRAGDYHVASQLQNVNRALYKIRVNLK